MRLLYTFLWLALAGLGNLANAQCTISDGNTGIRDFHVDYTLGKIMRAETERYILTCTSSVRLRFNTKVEDNFYNSFQAIVNDIPPSVPARLTALVDIDGDDNDNYRVRFRKEWKFPDKQYNSLSGTNEAEIPAGRYRVSIQNYSPSYSLPSNSKPYYYPWGMMSQVLFTLGNLGQTFSVTPHSGEDLCTSDSYQINTWPSSTIDFGELDRRDLNNGRHFSKDFSIEVSRVPGEECFELVYPDIEFNTEQPLIDGRQVAIDNGLLLSIEGKDKQSVIFGERMNMGRINATDQRLAKDFKGIIRKDPARSVKTGEFNAIIRYTVHMR